MPYYCTVPRCTSMAGKAKNVSFHQFPRDEELARLWNKILKRGKPYTKYSKVCSLHFKPEDYTITSVGKNKGQWRTLRKDAIPSQNLPSESPGPTPQRTRSSVAWVPALPPNVIDTRVQQQMAQAIYMQTMLAMQAATNGVSPMPTQNSSNHADSSIANASTSPISEIEQLLHNTTRNGMNHVRNNHYEQQTRIVKPENQSYQCEECTKCFKDPDVFVLHRRTHTKRSNQERIPSLNLEKENFNANSGNRQETLKANPILANLLKNGASGDVQEQIPGNFNNAIDNNILSIENQIMAALAANMESYIRNLSSMLSQAPKESNDSPEQSNHNNYEDKIDSDSDSNELKIDASESMDQISDLKEPKMEDSENTDEESDLNRHKTDASENKNEESDLNQHNIEASENTDKEANLNKHKIEASDNTDEESHLYEHNIEASEDTDEESDLNEHNIEASENMDEESYLNEHKMEVSDIALQESDSTGRVCMDSKPSNEISNNEGSTKEVRTEPNCDNEDLNELKDSYRLVIADNV